MTKCIKRVSVRYIQGGPKKLAQCFYMSITLSNINRFSKFFHCWNQEKIYGNTITIGPPHLSRVATLPGEISVSYGVGLTKPATFLRLRSPGHERACSRIHEASPVLRATVVYRHLLYTYIRGQSTK